MIISKTQPELKIKTASAIFWSWTEKFNCENAYKYEVGFFLSPAEQNWF